MLKTISSRSLSLVATECIEIFGDCSRTGLLSLSHGRVFILMLLVQPCRRFVCFKQLAASCQLLAARSLSSRRGSQSDIACATCLSSCAHSLLRFALLVVQFSSCRGVSNNMMILQLSTSSKSNLSETMP